MSIHVCRKNIVITGLSGSGKSSVADYISRKSRMDLYDTDYLIETITGLTVSELFLSKGEKYFRQIECLVVAEVAAAKSSVIACGGGIVLEKSNMELLGANGLVFCLWAELNELERRIGQSHERPLLNQNTYEQLLNQMNDRAGLYRSADFHINTQGMTIFQVGDQIMDLYVESCQN